MALIISLTAGAEVTVDVTDEQPGEATYIEHRVEQTDDDVIKDGGDETEKQES